MSKIYNQSPLMQTLPQPSIIKLMCMGIACFIGAMLTPAFHFAGDMHLSGVDILVTGWMGLLVLDPRWYANPLVLVALLATLFGRHPIATRCAISASLLAIGSFVLPIRYYFKENSGTLVDHLGIGAYLWLAAILLFTYICLLRRPRDH